MRRTQSLIWGLPIAALLATGLLPSSRVLAITGSVKPSVSALAKTYSKLPMSFEKNAGQTRSGVDFIARGSDYSVFLSAGEAVIAVKTHELPDRIFDPAAKHEGRLSTIEMTLVGSSPARAIAQDQLPGKANYFLGHDPTKWRRDLPTFAKVRYPNVYQGIDIVYYGNQGRLEYDFVIAPGADPSAITLCA
jgi:hypothetical protein